MQGLFRGASWSDENAFLNSLQTKKYPYGVGLMAAASLVVKRLCAVNVESVLEQFETKNFLKNELSLAAVNGPHCTSSIQKVAISRRPGIK